MKLLIIIAGFLLAGFAQPPRAYEEGQVWEYQARTQDSGSLVRIQRIELLRDIQVFHVSMIGLTLGGSPGQELPHAPVSRETLDRSVTWLATSAPAFPDAAQGIAIWRGENGGVFTLTLSEIVDVVEQMVARARTQ